MKLRCKIFGHKDAPYCGAVYKDGYKHAHCLRCGDYVEKIKLKRNGSIKL